MVLGLVGAEGFGFLRGLVGDVFGGPDLAVGVGVAGSHHGSAIFEDLDVAQVGLAAEFFVFGCPGVNDFADVGQRHAGEGEAVVGVEADDLAASALALGAEQWGGSGFGSGRVGQQGGVVVVENEYAFINGRKVPTGALVAGAEIAVRVVVNVREARGGIDLALPGALRAMGRNQDPLAAQRVVAAMRELRSGGQKRRSFRSVFARLAFPE